VPDGVVNITDTDHGVYPGTIRRTVLEVDGHLFVYTQGSGENRYQNAPLVSADHVPNPPIDALETLKNGATRVAAALSNDRFGPRAFKQLDNQLFKDVERVRSGEQLQPVDDAHLNPDDLLPKEMPPAIFTNGQKKGMEH
jgi:hypothetical protein